MKTIVVVKGNQFDGVAKTLTTYSESDAAPVELECRQTYHYEDPFAKAYTSRGNAAKEKSDGDANYPQSNAESSKAEGGYWSPAKLLVTEPEIKNITNLIEKDVYVELSPKAAIMLYKADKDLVKGVFARLTAEQAESNAKFITSWVKAGGKVAVTDVTNDEAVNSLAESVYSGIDSNLPCGSMNIVSGSVLVNPESKVLLGYSGVPQSEYKQKYLSNYFLGGEEVVDFTEDMTLRPALKTKTTAQPTRSHAAKKQTPKKPTKSQLKTKKLATAYSLF